jgi:hypothetical protein
LKGEIVCPFCGADPTARPRRPWVVAAVVVGVVATVAVAVLVFDG